MEQLLLHLFGDYVTQNDWMANSKTSSFYPAFVHALVYSLPFLVLSPSMLAFCAILFTHAVIDRYRLAKYVIFAKEWLGDRTLRWSECKQTGYHNSKPVWLSTWLMIVTDNFMHLAINYTALRWL